MPCAMMSARACELLVEAVFRFAGRAAGTVFFGAVFFAAVFFTAGRATFAGFAVAGFVDDFLAGFFAIREERKLLNIFGKISQN
jgi:hypothetical protein